MGDIKEIIMQNTKSTQVKEIWQKGYISNKTRLNEIDLSKCNKSKVTIYSHPSNGTQKKGKS